MPHLSWLDAEQPVGFPPTHLALPDPNGLLAAGGALTPDWLLTAYRHGIFPWYSEGEPILWWSPSPRMVLPVGTAHISRSLRKWYRHNQPLVTLNTAFETVIQACRQPRATQSGTWITDDMTDAYSQMHRLGWAHSVEVWQDGRLAGGLYGIGIWPLFYGESMFSLQPNTSKLAFVALDEWARQQHLTLIDCQVYNDHLASLGALTLPRSEFEPYLPVELVSLRAPGESELNRLVQQRMGIQPDDASG
ncbi:MAG: leucyl/phenylalanyl-tRNA--protein transferase [Saccharospirillum sp.]